MKKVKAHVTHEVLDECLQICSGIIPKEYTTLNN